MKKENRKSSMFYPGLFRIPNSKFRICDIRFP
jgi:hypothetical protein